jgi:4-nitrophenyl phosphatase
MTLSLTDVQNLLIDMDGVLYRGQTALEGSSDLIRFLQAHDLGYLLVTNNSTLSPLQFTERLAGMGMDVAPEHILTSGVATAEYLRTLAPNGAGVFVVGEAPLIAELEKRGFHLTGRDADYVVCGWDKGINFEKLRTATLAIRDGATFVGTNPDKTYPLENDLIPGAGALLAAISAATDVDPIIVGKPETIIFEQSLHMLGTDAEDTALLGDRLDTDILGGKRAGIATIMVLTGISTPEEVEASELKPDLLFPDLPALLSAWREVLEG